MSNDLKLTTRLNKAHLPVISTQQLVYVLVEAVPGGSFSQVETPLNLSLVLDKSGSMQGKKIQNLRAAAKLVVDRLGADDMLSIVAFSDRKYLIAESQPVNNPAELKSKIDRIRDGGGTAISGGMAQGLAELDKALTADRVSRMLLLTDGQTFGDEKQCKKLADQAGDKGIVVHALGLGDDWNEDLLDEIADASGGMSDFIDSPDKIITVFEKAVQSMQDTVVQNAQMVLRLANGVTPRQVWQVLPMISNLGYRPLSDRDVQVTLGEMEKGQPRSLLVELLIGPRPAGSYRIAQAEISYDVPGLGLVGEKVKSDILLDLTADPALAKEYDAEVMNIVEKVTAFKLQTRALEEAKLGNITGASEKLRAAATRLLEMGEEELAQSALDEAKNLEQTGQMTSHGTKKLRYETRKLTQRLTP
ncbi:MAG TPA: VWA domain-containing protein [Anaerolineae bacterium]|jgi:Ca-activated chloride channel homolog|nr:VWA domain-containing protein [Anaerolineae bacterium]